MNTLIYDSENSYPNGITGTSFILPPGILQWGKQYRWNMRSRSSSGWSTQFSSPFCFQTSTPAFAPQIMSINPNPIIGSNSRINITITGNGFVQGATLIFRDKTFNQIFPIE